MTNDRISNLSAHGFVTKIGVYALGMVASVAIARALGPVGRGAYFVPITAGTIAFQIASIGLPEAQFRLFSRELLGAGQLITAGLISAAAAGALGALATYLIFLINPGGVFDDVPSRFMVLAVIPIPLMIHATVLAVNLATWRKLRLSNLARLAGAIVQTSGALLLYAAGELTVEAVILLWGLSYCTPWAIRLRGALRTHKPAPIRFKLLRQQAALGVGYLPSALFLYLNLRLDVFFLAHYRGLAEVGIYSVAVIFGELIWLVTDSMTQAIVERQAMADLEELGDVTTRAIRMNLLLSLLLGVSIGIVGQAAIPLVYGAEFASAAILVWLLIPAAMAMAVWRTSLPVLTRHSASWHPAAIAALSLFVNVVANLVLVPDLGARGAAIASTISYGLGAVLAARLMLKHTTLGARHLVPTGDELRLLIGRAREIIHDLAST